MVGLSNTSLDRLSINGQDVANFSVQSGESLNAPYGNGEIVNGDGIHRLSNGDHASNGLLNGGSKVDQGINGFHQNGTYATGAESSGQSPIAICGMALRLPAGLKTPQQLWEFLLAKGDARRKVPESRFNVSAFRDANGKAGTTAAEYGYFIEDDLGMLDTSFFSMPKKEVERADPQQRLMLEVTRECFEDAGMTNWKGKTIGCYMGSFGEDWCEMSTRDTQNWGMYRSIGWGDFTLSNRISYEMDLQGPSMTVRTACSASLSALHEACNSLLRGDCEAAVVGGVNLIMTPGMSISLSEHSVLSVDGSCKTFSADANGYARGEAITAVCLKRLDDALRDGNPVRAVIRGSASNHDGKTQGLTIPSTDAQEALIRRAYEAAGIKDYSRTGFVECHGTGTPTGDPIEVKAVARVFGGNGVYIGAIKPNLGHTEGASGLLSVIKTVLTLEHRTIPPNIKFTSPNPAIPFKSAQMTVPLEPTPWPSHRAERASVNSFGVGGSNAHVIIDSAASHVSPPKVSAQLPASDEPQLLLFSANTQKSLNRMIENYRRFVEENPHSIGDLAFTLANRREHLTYRAFAVVENGNVETVSSISKIGKPPAIVMVFTGQGAQWPQMGIDLMHSNPTFQKSIRALDNHMRTISKAVIQWSIEEELRKPGKRSRVSKAEFSQPLCTAIQIALVDAMAAIGVYPDAVVGHSSGEIAAAYASGALNAGEAIMIALQRGAVTNLQSRIGAMAAIGMSWEETEKCLLPGVNIACDNSPKNVTISGDSDKIEEVMASIQKMQPNVSVRKLQVDKAYHSHHMAEIGEDYHFLIDSGLTTKEPKKPFFSTVTGKLADHSTRLDSRYWQKNLEFPVLFRGAVSNILEHPVGKHAVFLEIGPHSALAGPLRHIFTYKSGTASYISAMVRNRSCTGALLTAAGQLFTLQGPVDLKALIPTGACLPDLPRYPWDHEESYWFEPRLSKEYRQRKEPHHGLLGSRSPESTDLEPSWRNMFHLETSPWVREHKVGDDIIFPFAGYVSIAGEAVRQITGINHSYRLRHVLVHTALVIPEDRPTEIVTTLRRQRLTDSLNSQWWEFTIYTHNGHMWIKHCSGEVTAQDRGLERSDVSKNFPNLPRQVDVRKWFNVLKRGDFNFGPSFQNLGNVSVGTKAQKAQGTLYSHRGGDSSSYHLHPLIVDAALQLMAISIAKGQGRNHRSRLPVGCEELTVSRSSSDVVMNVITKPMSNSMLGEGSGVANGDPVLKFQGMKFALVDKSESAEQAGTHAAACLKWTPDIDFLDTRDFIKGSKNLPEYIPPLEELYHLCLLRTHRSLEGLSVQRPHMQKFQRWIDDQFMSLNISSLSGLEEQAVSDQIKGIISRLDGTPAAGAAIALQKVCESINAIFSAQGSSWKTILTDKEIEGLHEFINQADTSPFIQRSASNKPNLRVLEIGSWKDSPSNRILQDLTLPNGQPLYSKYTFTSRGFTSAQEYDTNLPNVGYATLDINEDPLEQGFELQEYDLIVANKVLHTTKRISDSLKNIGKLLHPDGRLLLQELWPSSKWINYIFGTHPSWWSAATDQRPNEPYIDTDRWQSELADAGFVEPSSIILDSSEPFQMNSIMVVSPSKTELRPKRVSLLCNDTLDDLGPIVRELEGKGYQVDKCTLRDEVPAGQDVVCILDRDGPFFEAIAPSMFEAFQNFITRLNDSGIFWVTVSSQMHVQDPRYAQVIGTARTMRSEMLIDFATCEVQDIDTSASQICQVFSKYHMRTPDKSLSPDSEYSIHNGVVYVSRFYPFSLVNDLSTSDPSDRTVLDVGVPGRLSTLHWVREPDAHILQPNEVELEIHAVGLNFRDLLVAMDIVELPERIFGVEGAGVVRRVGSEIKTLQAGDRVATLERRTFSTRVVTVEDLCIKIPDNLGFEEASAMFMPYATAAHSLITIGGLEKGMSVLIHSAAGGVGLAAVQLALMYEAELYVTVGSEEKIQHLMSTFNIPRDRIFNSRNESFLEGIMNKTNGEGVDLVLNSLSGELLHLTWKCVAPFGRLVEIGKRDLIGRGKLDMNVFLANRTYSCVDIDSFREKPSMIKKLMSLITDLLEKGSITPVRPVKSFEAASVDKAFRYMQSGQHIGRIAISLRKSPAESAIGEVSNRPKKIELDESASYLLVGGLGGIGRAVSTWMVENGARHLVYLSRNAGLNPEHDQFMKELGDMGCDVQFLQGSVIDMNDVAKAIKETTPPIKGILQMSMVLQDESFPNMTAEQWNTVTSVKVQGTWNLHNATVSAGLDLDFFVLFSSLSGAVGQPGQTSYASANTFLDAFAQYRRNLGLPACAIGIGPVRDVGVVSRNVGLMRKMESTGYKALTEQEVLDALQIAMTAKHQLSDQNGNSFIDKNSFVVGLESTVPLNSPANRAIWRRDRRMAIYHNTSSGDATDAKGSNANLKMYIANAKAEPSILKTAEASSFFAAEIGKSLFSLLMKPEEDLNTSLSLIDLGMDSLVAIELRSWWKQAFGFDISVLEMRGIGTLEALGQHAAKGLIGVIATEGADA